MVPGSMLIWGSNFWIVTLRPRFFKSRPKLAATIPFPIEETTPPVTKIFSWLLFIKHSFQVTSTLLVAYLEEDLPIIYLKKKNSSWKQLWPLKRGARKKYDIANLKNCQMISVSSHPFSPILMTCVSNSKSGMHSARSRRIRSRLPGRISTGVLALPWIVKWHPWSPHQTYNTRCHGHPAKPKCLCIPMN